jgi:hypothetical protein
LDKTIAPHRRRTHDARYEWLVVGMGVGMGAIVVGSVAGISYLAARTRDPPYEQWLVGMGRVRRRFGS